MNYRFNFSFLHDWYDTNHVTKKEICMAVENTDFTSVNRWINGEQTMPTDSILRFCNYFEVPLECFFLDYDAHATLSPRQPTVNDQTEPAGGYPEGKKRRGQRGVNPATTEHHPSRIPYILISPNADGTVEVENRVLESKENGVMSNEERIDVAPSYPHRSDHIKVIGIDDEDTTTSHSSSDMLHSDTVTQTEDILQLRLAHQKEINNLMTQYHEREERMRSDYEHKLETEKERLYRIIEQQSNAIANFQSILKNGGKYHDGITGDSGLAEEQSPTNS